MFGMGMGEILLIAVVALLVVGPDRLPGAAKAIGKGIRDLRASTKDLQSTIELDTEIGEAVREIKGALRGDPESLYKRATGEDFHAPPKEAGESEPPGEEGEDAPHDESGNPIEPSSSDEAKTGDTSSAKLDPELGAQLDKAYDNSNDNSNDNWGTTATNPHEAEEAKPDPDLPMVKQPTGSVARDPQDGNVGDDDSKNG
ncbi:MAG: hypothetical protein GY811_08510 [Myxococcales bacterium]|nr:hypothetical protein [Myxococcales bacterium]